MPEKYVFINTKVPGIWIVDSALPPDSPEPNDIDFKNDWLFTFDKKKIFNFWPDYPNKLTKEQIEIFKKAFPEMAKLRG